MSRSGYHDDHDDPWQLIRWRGQVASATRGQRGQRMFREMRTALESMPVKRLVADDLITEEGDVCAFGALGVARGIDMQNVDPDDPQQVGHAFDVAHQLASEVEYMNDEDGHPKETPEQRYERMYEWVCSQIREPGDGQA